MIVNSSGKLLTESFFIGQTKLTNVTRYIYLGMEISCSGSLTPANNYIKDKANKAKFKLFKLLSSGNFKPKTCLKLFDQLILPICLYGSEIWGTNILKNKNKDKKYALENKYDKLPVEIVHLSFLKFSLGCHKKSTNDAVRGEGGKFPIFIKNLHPASNIFTPYT